MIIKNLIVQKINSSGGLVYYFASSKDSFLSWTFESEKGAPAPKDKNVFPFVLQGKHVLKNKIPGNESKCNIESDGAIIFEDTYHVPGEFAICIVGPEGFVPTMLKFPANMRIPADSPNQTTASPGAIQIFSNKTSKQTGIAMSITSNSFFSFSVMFTPVAGEYPVYPKNYYHDLFEASLASQKLPFEGITMDELRSVCSNIKSDKEVELLAAINSLIEAIRVNHYEAQSRAKKDLQDVVLDFLGAGGSIVTIADSYAQSNSVYTFLQTVLKYFS